MNQLVAGSNPVNNPICLHPKSLFWCLFHIFYLKLLTSNLILSLHSLVVSRLGFSGKISTATPRRRSSKNRVKYLPRVATFTKTLSQPNFWQLPDSSTRGWAWGRLIRKGIIYKSARLELPNLTRMAPRSAIRFNFMSKWFYTNRAARVRRTRAGYNFGRRGKRAVEFRVRRSRARGHLKSQFNLTGAVSDNSLFQRNGADEAAPKRQDACRASEDAADLQPLFLRLRTLRVAAGYRCGGVFHKKPTTLWSWYAKRSVYALWANEVNSFNQSSIFPFGSKLRHSRVGSRPPARKPWKKRRMGSKFILQAHWRNRWYVGRQFGLRRILLKSIITRPSFRLRAFTQKFVMRLDAILVKTLKVRTLRFARLLVKSGHVFINGRLSIEPELSVRRLDVITLSAVARRWVLFMRRRQSFIKRFKHTKRAIRRRRRAKRRFFRRRKLYLNRVFTLPKVRKMRRFLRGRYRYWCGIVPFSKRMEQRRLARVYRRKGRFLALFRGRRNYSKMRRQIFGEYLKKENRDRRVDRRRSLLTRYMQLRVRKKPVWRGRVRRTRLEARNYWAKRRRLRYRRRARAAMRRQRIRPRFRRKRKGARRSWRPYLVGPRLRYVIMWNLSTLCGRRAFSKKTLGRFSPKQIRLLYSTLRD